MGCRRDCSWSKVGHYDDMKRNKVIMNNAARVYFGPFVGRVPLSIDGADHKRCLERYRSSSRPYSASTVSYNILVWYRGCRMIPITIMIGLEET